MKIKHFIPVVFIAFLSMISSCGIKKEVPTKNYLKTCFHVEPQTVDPSKCSDFNSSTLCCMLFEGLTRCTKDAEFELALAEKVSISTDGKTYLFSLKKTFWNDGTLLTAHDFERSWKKALTPTKPSPCAYLLFSIKNAEKYFHGKETENAVGIKALDDQLLQVELEQPTAYFLSLTAFPTFLPFPDVNDIDSRFWSQNQNLPFICNGPFSLDSAKTGAFIQLKPNERYWNKTQVKLQGIDIKIIRDETLAIHLFQKGDLDLVGGPFINLSENSIHQFLQDPCLRFLSSAASTFCSFNLEKPISNNLNFRKALTYSLENHEILQSEITKNQQIIAQNILPPSLRCDFSKTQKQQTVHNPNFYLTQALHELNLQKTDLNKLTLYYRPFPIEKKIAQILQFTWKETLGIHIQIQQVDPKALAQKLYDKNYELALCSWIAQFHDPVNILERFKDPKNSKNYPGYYNEYFANLLAKSYKLISQELRTELLSQAEQTLSLDHAIIPLYHWRSPILISPKVKNFQTTKSGGILLEGCFLENK